MLFEAQSSGRIFVVETVIAAGSWRATCLCLLTMADYAMYVQGSPPTNGIELQLMNVTL